MRRLTEIRCAVIGYGGAFNMGKHHAEMMERTGVMRVVAVCDIDPQRLEAAKSELPNINTYISVDDLLAKEDF
ncbi:MAG: Gfo/Idh/MocA family oxidoreductase, partial [Armatimonadota bacterium]